MSLLILAVIHSFVIQFVYSQSCTAKAGAKLKLYGYPNRKSAATAFGYGGSSLTGQWYNGGTAGGRGTYADPETFATALTNTMFTNAKWSTSLSFRNISDTMTSASNAPPTLLLD
ncbi:hypothetical protein N7G274_006494 [Stereocaulon virgatum]|uniref:Carboxylic ester hydrolase n=1 Tax=Stereocaulon virgatum TaxID=373712 RepID=A0ABR4A614_9LECA